VPCDGAIAARRLATTEETAALRVWVRPAGDGQTGPVETELGAFGQCREARLAAGVARRVAAYALDAESRLTFLGDGTAGAAQGELLFARGAVPAVEGIVDTLCRGLARLAVRRARTVDAGFVGSAKHAACACGTTFEIYAELPAGAADIIGLGALDSRRRAERETALQK